MHDHLRPAAEVFFHNVYTDTNLSYNVVTTVRSLEKGARILRAHSTNPESKLSYVAGQLTRWLGLVLDIYITSCIAHSR